MRKLGSDPSKWLTFDDLVEQLKSVGKYGVIMAAMALQVLVSDPKNVIDMDHLTTDTKDTNDAIEFATLDESTAFSFKGRLSDVIKDAVRFGWL